MGGAYASARSAEVARGGSVGEARVAPRGGAHRHTTGRVTEARVGPRSRGRGVAR